MSGWRWLFRKRRDRELEEEIQSHLTMAARERIERGDTPDTAELAALLCAGTPSGSRGTDGCFATRVGAIDAS